MNVRSLLLLTTFLLAAMLSGCSTDEKAATAWTPEQEHAPSITSTASAVACNACHSNAPHYGGSWLASENPGNRAQYVGYSLVGQVNIGTSATPVFTTVDYTIDCSSCHINNDIAANREIRRQYAASGHADVTATPWTAPIVGAGCQRCHTTFGFLNFLAGLPGITLTTTDPVTQAIGQRESYQNAMQVLVCSACHTDLSSGALHPLGAFTATWTANGVTATFSFPPAGNSELCIRCHSSRRAGVNITSAATTTAHFLPSAATVFSGIDGIVAITATPAAPVIAQSGPKDGLGYEFSGRDYANPNLSSHRNVGMPGKGPCVACHMSGSAGHTLMPVAKDDSGQITAINSTACPVCHSDMTPARLNSKRSAFATAVAALDAALQAKGFYLNPADGNFYKDALFVSPIGTGTSNTEITASANAYYDAQAAAFALDRTDLRGTAFNLWLFRYHGGDPAAYVHNNNYSNKILFDSLDYLDNGVLDGTTAIADAIAADYLDGDGNTAGTQRP